MYFKAHLNTTLKSSVKMNDGSKRMLNNVTDTAKTRSQQNSVSTTKLKTKSHLKINK